MWHWGFIKCFRTDNGAPFGDPTCQSLTPLNLCLKGFGIAVKLNPRRSPRKNAKVERNQGTTARWADPGKCENYLDLQDKLNQAVSDQREHYPTRVCQGKTRAESYPALYANTRKFDLTDFSMDRIYNFLAQGAWQRKINMNGKTHVFGATYQVGYPLRNKELTVTFDKQNLNWNFCDEKGNIQRSLPAKNITEQHIRSLSYCQ